MNNRIWTRGSAPHRDFENEKENPDTERSSITDLYSLDQWRQDNGERFSALKPSVRAAVLEVLSTVLIAAERFDDRNDFPPTSKVCRSIRNWVSGTNYDGVHGP